VLDQKLKLLTEHAVFQVNINSVLGSGVKNPRTRWQWRAERRNWGSPAPWASCMTVRGS